MKSSSSVVELVMLLCSQASHLSILSFFISQSLIAVHPFTPPYHHCFLPLFHVLFIPPSFPVFVYRSFHFFIPPPCRLHPFTFNFSNHTYLSLCKIESFRVGWSSVANTVSATLLNQMPVWNTANEHCNFACT